MSSRLAVPVSVLVSAFLATASAGCTKASAAPAVPVTSAAVEVELDEHLASRIGHHLARIKAKMALEQDVAMR